MPAVVPEDCRHQAVVMQLTWMLEDSATVFITTSLTEAASSEAELSCMGNAKGKMLLLTLSVRAVSVVK